MFWNKNVVEESRKPIVRKFKTWKVYSIFWRKYFGAGPADIQLIRKLSKEILFLSCVIHIYSKYIQAIPLKEKKSVTITNAFQILYESGLKSNKIWVDKGSEFYNRSMKSCLQNNVTEISSTHNEAEMLLQLERKLLM